MNAKDFSTMPEAALAAWATKNLPARLEVVATARLLGFAEHDIQILMAASLLTPLGDPAANAPKWFATIELIRLATDEQWLHKATKVVAKYWRQKRERRSTVHAPRSSNGRSARENRAEKVSPDSSPGEDWAGAGEAVNGQ